MTLCKSQIPNHQVLTGEDRPRLSRVAGCCVGARQPGSLSRLEPANQVPYRPAHCPSASRRIQGSQVETPRVDRAGGRLSLHLNQLIVAGQQGRPDCDRVLGVGRHCRATSAWGWRRAGSRVASGDRAGNQRRLQSHRKERRRFGTSTLERTFDEGMSQRLLVERCGAIRSRTMLLKEPIANSEQPIAVVGLERPRPRRS
jgi:hypothetical protein